MSEITGSQEDPFVRARFEIAKIRLKVATTEAIALGGLGAVSALAGGKIGSLFGVGIGIMSGVYGNDAMQTRTVVSELEVQLDQTQIVEAELQ